MADYAIGDVQGCYDALMRLLDHLHFDEKKDTLWFVGDLVNRGPDSLAVLRFIYQLPLKAKITLGNHDLHFLTRYETNSSREYPGDTLDELLHAEDTDNLATWLRHQPLLIHDTELNILMCHAGIAPLWTLNEAKAYAHRFEQALQGEHYKTLLNQLYGNEPTLIEASQDEFDTLRLICNYFTRMRFCDAQGRLVFPYKGPINTAPPDVYPWFDVPHRQPITQDIIFGHWAALDGQCSTPHLYALDTGCVWGRTLTALCLNTKERFSISAGA
ncbi:MAG: symmetrical bis(5'-nucleosyl)-tetraphosphatase [Legionellaceae bacterium]